MATWLAWCVPKGDTRAAFPPSLPQGLPGLLGTPAHTSAEICVHSGPPFPPLAIRGAQLQTCKCSVERYERGDGLRTGRVGSVGRSTVCVWGRGDTVLFSLLILTQVNKEIICGGCWVAYLLFHILFARPSVSASCCVTRNPCLCGSKKELHMP